MGPLWGGPSSTDKSNTHYYANYITPPIVRNSPIYYKARPEISNITKVHKEPSWSSFPPDLPSGFFFTQLPLPGVFSLSPMIPPERGYTVHIKTATTLLTVKTTPHHLSWRNGVSIYTPPPPTNLLTMGWTLLKSPEIRGVHKMAFLFTHHLLPANLFTMGWPLLKAPEIRGSGSIHSNTAVTASTTKTIKRNCGWVTAPFTRVWSPPFAFSLGIFPCEFIHSETLDALRPVSSQDEPLSLAVVKKRGVRVLMIQCW